MEFSRIDVIGNNDRILTELHELITKGNYNGNARGDENGNKWSTTDILTQFNSTLSAPLASCILSGTDSGGRIVKRTALIDTLMVKIKVLSRQACFRDVDGDRLLTNPTSPKQVLSTDLPVEGDQVRVSQGPQMTNEITGKNLTFHQRNRVIAEGKQLKTFEYYEVDEDGCIIVPLREAMSLLKKSGIRIAFPEFGLAHTRVKDVEEGEKRRITNWLFEEVAIDYEAPKPEPEEKPEEPEVKAAETPTSEDPKELTPQQKAAITRAENKAKKEAAKLEDNDN
jgi:hypothetical protein